ncbi:hypothetical protein [Nocardioides sp. LML1-1-1.1]|uniref:ATP-binding protein n=1 Tax=Nocardioides sp. LML1-1-1.1 TaxID=3135248 RepID=UPI00342CD4AF
MGPRRPVARAFGAAVERGLHRALGLALLVAAPAFVVRLGPLEDLDEVELLSAGAVVLCLLTIALRCLGRGPGGFDLLLATLALAVGTTMAHPEPPVVPLVTPLLVVVAARRPRPAVPLLAIAVLYAVLRWAEEGTPGLREGTVEAVLAGGTALALLALVSRVRQAALRADARLDSHREVHRAHLSAAEVETTAFLHDDLVPTLLAVGSLPDSPDTHAAARAALTRLTGPAHGEDTADLVTALRAAAAREMLDAQVVSRGPRTHLPEAVREAVLGAAGEALRNVARHSGQRQATVTVVRRPTALRVRVEDSGAGLSGTQGVGIRVAILGRLESIGGTARVTGSPGGGTVVELTWRARLVARLLGLTTDLEQPVRAAVGDPGGVARQVAAVLAATYLTAGILLGRDQPAPTWSWAAAALLVALVLVLATAMSRGAPHPALLVPVAVVPAGVVALVDPAQAWLVGCAVLPALTVAWVVSGRMLLVLLAPSGAVLLARGLPELLALPLVDALAVALAVAVCRRAGRVLTAPARPEVTAHAAALSAALGPILRPVVVALRTVGTPDAPTEPAPALLAQAVRDCLYLPGPGHEELRIAIDQLRRGGIHVDTIITDLPPATRTLAAALATAGRTGATRVTVSGNPEEVTVVAVPGPGPELAERLPRLLPVAWRVDADPEVAVLSGPPDLATLIRRGDRRRVRD